MSRKFSEIEQIRRDKLVKLTEMGKRVFGQARPFTDTSKSLEEKFGKFTKEELAEKNEPASIALRVNTFRGPFIMGKDRLGVVQAYIGKDITELVDLVKLLDIGDIIYITGTVMKTGTGVLTIRANNIEVGAKSLKQLPEKWHGLKDQEERYRNRHIDLLVNEDTRNVFIKRTKIISSIRKFFDELEYLEAETPILQAILGGATARPFNTHHNALDMPFYLRIATELPLKQLLVGGFERVYEIGRIFRNEGIDTTHNPEFTSIEFYEAHSDLEGMMKRTEDVFRYIAKVLEIDVLEFDGKVIEINKPFHRLNMVEAVNEKTGENFYEISFEDAKKIALKHKIKIESYFKTGHIINELFEALVENDLIQPTFVYGHPIEISPLATKSVDRPLFTDRAELFINTKEYANMFTELNDPLDQLERFENQLSEREGGNDEASEIDMGYVEALEYGMPPAGGCGIGIDRLVMLFTGKTSIREVLLFPHMKDKV